jgi:hypothetical protein
MPDTTTVPTVMRQGEYGRGRAFDAADPRHAGLPAWTQDSVPGHLHTRRQLTAQGLRRGRQTVCGLVFWPGPAGPRCARLYDTGQAVRRWPRLRRTTSQPG